MDDANDDREAAMAGDRRRAAACPSDDDPVDADAETFRERALAGDYPALHDPGLAETLARAALPHGLGAEAGALRVALARLIEEERDPSRFAAGVARLVAVAVQVAQAQRAAGAAAEAAVAEARANALIDLGRGGGGETDGEHEHDDARRAGPGPGDGPRGADPADGGGAGG